MNLTLEHLYTAWSLVKRGTKAAGIDGIPTAFYGADLEHQLTHLHRQLTREVYGASPARGLALPKKSGGTRIVGIPTVNDRLVQRYLLQAAYPSLEKTMSSAAHAYRLGYSIFTAVEQVMERYRHQPML